MRKLHVPILFLAVALPLGCYTPAAFADHCPDYVLYVCGSKNGHHKTYINSCFATNDGATQLTDGKCKTRWPVLKHHHPASSN